MFTRSIFNEDHEAFRSQVRRFVENEIAPNHDEWENAGRVSRDAWLKAGENGLLLAAIPEEYGGAWADARVGRIAGGTGGIMREIIGRALLGERK